MNEAERIARTLAAKDVSRGTARRSAPETITDDSLSVDRTKQDAETFARMRQAVTDAAEQAAEANRLLALQVDRVRFVEEERNRARERVAGLERRLDQYEGRADGEARQRVRTDPIRLRVALFHGAVDGSFRLTLLSDDDVRASITLRPHSTASRSTDAVVIPPHSAETVAEGGLIPTAASVAAAAARVFSFDTPQPTPNSFTTDQEAGLMRHIERVALEGVRDPATIQEALEAWAAEDPRNRVLELTPVEAFMASARRGGHDDLEPITAEEATEGLRLERADDERMARRDLRLLHGTERDTRAAGIMRNMRAAASDSFPLTVVLTRDYLAFHWDVTRAGQALRFRLPTNIHWRRSYSLPNSSASGAESWETSGLTHAQIDARYRTALGRSAPAAVILQRAGSGIEVTQVWSRLMGNGRALTYPDRRRIVPMASFMGGGETVIPIHRMD